MLSPASAAAGSVVDVMDVVVQGAGPRDTQLSLRKATNNLLVAMIEKHGRRSRFVKITAYNSSLKWNRGVYIGQDRRATLLPAFRWVF